MLLEQMLEAEAAHESLFEQFPHMKIWRPLYDGLTAPLKLLLISLDRQRKVLSRSAAAYE